MSNNEYDAHPEMTEAANRAGVELLKINTKAEVADWMRRWWREAGYKRLAQVLMMKK